MFNQLKFSPEQISAEVARTMQALADQPGGDAAAYAALVVGERLREHPARYIEFGPYWWAVKAALRSQGKDFGEADDGQIREAYAGELPPLDAIVAGELFKDVYRRTYFAGTTVFALDEDAAQPYVLFDPNMEARRLGRGSLAVAANLEAHQMPDEPEKPGQAAPEPAAS